MKALLKIQGDGYTPNVLSSMALDATVKVYQQLRIDSMSVVNMGGSGGNNDVAGQLIGNMLASYKSISEGLNKKN